MLEKMSLARPQSKLLPPPIDGLINGNMIKVWPDLNKMLFQLIDITYALLMFSVLETVPNFVVNWVKNSIVMWPEIG